MKNLIICIIVQFGLFIIFYLALEDKKDKVVFVNLNKVYEEFELKKELEKKFKNLESKRNALLDSLELNLKLLSSKPLNTASQEQIAEYDAKKETYFVKKQQFNEDNKVVMEQYHSQIITKLNEYVKLYGKQKHLTYILGSDDSGSILYGEETREVTPDVIKFINALYKKN